MLYVSFSDKAGAGKSAFLPTCIDEFGLRTLLSSAR